MILIKLPLNLRMNLSIVKIHALLLILAFSFHANADVSDPEDNFFQKTFGDYTEELELAREANKIGILIMFGQEDCPYCYRMKTTILNQIAVQHHYKKYFSIFYVDIEGDTEIVNFDGVEMSEKDFSFKVNRVRATPVFIFYDSQGKKIVKYTGPTSGVDEFMLLAKYVIDKQYLKMSFTRFKQQHKI